MKVRDLVDMLPTEVNADILVHDLDTGYLVPVEKVTWGEVDGNPVVIVKAVDYSDDRFPWNIESHQMGGY